MGTSHHLVERKDIVIENVAQLTGVFSLREATTRHKHPGCAAGSKALRENLHHAHHPLPRPQPIPEEDDPQPGVERAGVWEAADGGGHTRLVDELLP